MVLREIALEFDLTRERIRQIKAEALDKMRECKILEEYV